MDIIHSVNFVSDATDLILKAGKEAIERNGVFRLSLCGGNTPKPVYAELAKRGGELDWRKAQITFGDERCVPPEDAQSNYRMAKLAMFDALALPEGNVFRMKGELDPQDAATEYERKLSEVASRFGEERYVHDLLLLGVGDDGHTASLFPGTDALNETQKNVVANYVPKFDTYRITFTYPLINAARRIVFLVNDAGKASVIDEILSGKSDYPAGKIKPAAVSWMLGF